MPCGSSSIVALGSFPLKYSSSHVLITAMCLGKSFSCAWGEFMHGTSDENGVLSVLRFVMCSSVSAVSSVFISSIPNGEI